MIPDPGFVKHPNIDKPSRRGLDPIPTHRVPWLQCPRRILHKASHPSKNRLKGDSPKAAMASLPAVLNHIDQAAAEHSTPGGP